MTLLIVACASPKPVQQPVDDLQQTVEARLGKDAVEIKNKDGSFSLYTKEHIDPANGIPVIKYLIVRMYDKKAVEEGSVTMGAVGWSGDYEVEISQAPGQPQLARDRNATSRKIDVRKYIVNAR
jgi:hypothetical protein